MAESWILMECGCKIDCNVKPKGTGDYRKIGMMPPIQFQNEKLTNPTLEMAQLMVRAHEGNWIEIGTENMDRESFRGAHEFIRDRRSTPSQRRKALLRFSVTNGQVPRCWIKIEPSLEKSGTV